jgi:hypothetical protein
MSDKGLVFRLYIEALQLDNKSLKISTGLKWTLPKKIYKWQISP